MIKNVEMGINYALYLLPLYGQIKHNVRVIGKTNIDNVTYNQDKYNIYKTYFEPIGLGLASYYSIIKENTVIYICVKISSLNPFALSKEKVFIPESLIDMNASDIYVEAQNFNFNIYPIIRSMKTQQEIDDFIKEIKIKVSNRLNEIIEFASTEDYEINIDYETLYLTKEIVDEIMTKRQTNYNDFFNRMRKKQSIDLIKENNYNKLLVDLNSSKEEHERAIKELEKAKEEYIKKRKQYEELIQSQISGP